MKINEVIEPSRKTLIENLKSDNHDSQFVAEDLADMVEESMSGQWSSTDGKDYLLQLKAGKPSWL